MKKKREESRKRENEIPWEALCFSKLSGRYLGSSSAPSSYNGARCVVSVPCLLQAHHDKIRATDPSPDRSGIWANPRPVSQKSRLCPNADARWHVNGFDRQTIKQNQPWVLSRGSRELFIFPRVCFSSLNSCCRVVYRRNEMGSHK